MQPDSQLPQDASSAAASAAMAGYRPSRGFVMTLGVVYALGALVLLASDPASSSAEPEAARWLTSLDTRATPAIAVLPVRPVAAKQPAVPDSAALERAVLARLDHAPLAHVLRRRAAHEPGLADRVASALIKESQRLRIAPSLLAGVLLTENPRLETETVSSQGAMGLMQVMPFHAGEYGCESTDLLQVESNICHGARVFGGYMKRTRTVETALLRYNGCVRSVNTPNCQRYPSKVLRKAGQVRRMMIQYGQAGRRAARSGT